MKILESKFVKGFIKMADDGYYCLSRFVADLQSPP